LNQCPLVLRLECNDPSWQYSNAYSHVFVALRLKTTPNCLEGVAIQFQWASLATAGRRWFATLPPHLETAPSHRLWHKRTLLRSVRSGPHLLAGGLWPARITGWIHSLLSVLRCAGVAKGKL
jgi:hypothetical protein